MNPAAPTYVLDSFALLAYFQDEAAADDVEKLLVGAQQGRVRLAISVITIGEVFYRTVRQFGMNRAEEVLGCLEEYEIDVVDVDRRLALSAARIKGSHGMGYADCFVAALARRLGGRVVTGDPDFRRVEGMVPIEWLAPYTGP